MEVRNLEVNPKPFYAVYKSDALTVVQQGGARSGKTYGILQAHIAELVDPALKDAGLVFSIVRKSGVSLAQSAQRDFFDILHSLGLYNAAHHKRTKPEEYRLNGNLVEFMGIDNPDKKRGTSRDYLFVNEANELTWDDYNQLAMRTRKRVVIDYNPSFTDHWIFDKVMHAEGTKYVHSTWRDNRFLPKKIVDYLESLKDIDPVAYKVFNLGEAAEIRGKIYPNWQPVDTFRGDVVYGLDFGFNNETALVKCGMYDGELYVEQLIYESGLTNSDLIAKMDKLSISGRIYCDAAEPQRIEELRRAGYDAYSANKSVKDGIDFVKRHKINVVSSPDIEDEIKYYRWKEDANGNVLDEPVKSKDHAMDAMRYGVFTEWYVPMLTTVPMHTTERLLDSDHRQWSAF